MPGRKLSLKVVTNKEKTKVLFAEANTIFIDVLLSFLALPLGKVVTILSESYGAAAVPGSLHSLYGGVSDLDEAYFSVPGAKEMLLNLRELAVDISYSPPDEFFICSDIYCPISGNGDISLYYNTAFCGCGKPLTAIFVDDEYGYGSWPVFTVGPSSFIITDDLRVAPIVTGAIQTLSSLGITDTRGAEIRFPVLIRDLLRYSLISATPLSDMILKKTSFTKPEPGILLHNIPKSIFRSRKMVLKVWLQKSTNKFIFAEAMDDFLEFLFSFLTVPLGAVEFLLRGNTGLKNIDNLYQSVSNGIGKKHFITPEAKIRLLNPKLPYGYRSKNQFLPLGENTPRAPIPSSPNLSFKSNKEFYVKKQTMCFVKDDLTVSPSLATSISNGFGIPLSDTKNVELQIGMKEALRILKASLTSKTVLTDALIEPMLNKQPTVERIKNLEFLIFNWWVKLFFGFSLAFAIGFAMGKRISF